MLPTECRRAPAFMKTATTYYFRTTTNTFERFRKSQCVGEQAALIPYFNRKSPLCLATERTLLLENGGYLLLSNGFESPTAWERR